MRDLFYGWYMKCQSDSQTLALIPAVHRIEGKRICSIQVITDEGVFSECFPFEAFRMQNGNMAIGENWFGRKGIRLSINTSKLYIKGKVNFGSLSPLKYDIMGPFALIPCMECLHSVWSMRHPVQGIVNVNGKKYVFKNAWGYWEGDRGRSFPKEYAWTQCCFRGGSLMLSVADIPLAGFHFTGIIGIVLWQGREYRLATYLGARAVKIAKGVIRIIQGKMELEVRLPEYANGRLMAPDCGEMKRTIHENVSGKAFYRFQKAGNTLFAFETNFASFEYEYSF
ncbi:MAG: tocopherol cyclase family protein [Lachnospiraceae bacterium]